MVWFLSENPDGEYVSSPRKGNTWEKLNIFHENIYFKNENNIYLNSEYNSGEINDTIICNDSKIDGNKIFQIFGKTNESMQVSNIDIAINKLGYSEKFTGKKENSGFFIISPLFFNDRFRLIGSLEIEANHYDDIKRRVFLGKKSCIIFSFSGPLLKAETPIGANASITGDIFLKEDHTYRASYFSVIIQSYPS